MYSAKGSILGSINACDGTDTTLDTTTPKGEVFFFHCPSPRPLYSSRSAPSPLRPMYTADYATYFQIFPKLSPDGEVLPLPVLPAEPL